MIETSKSIQLWNTVCSILNSRLPKWRDRINNGGQVSAVEARENGYQFFDKEVFEGIVKAVLSNSTDWSKIERVLPELHTLFHDFDIEFYSGLTAQDVIRDFLPWFENRWAGSLTMKQSLTSLIETAKQLCEYSQRFGSLDRYFISLLKMCNNDTVTLVEKLGSPKSKYKLPAMGLAIAAEALKNIGFDVAKPDRHINRAVGSFKFVSFSKWPDRSERKPPQCSEKDLIEVMRAMDRFATSVGVRVSFLDNAIWLLCCKSGLYLSNQQLSKLM